ncbi:endonuclease VII domain-containing protein [Actinomadura sp. 6N118]|uniref:endonuclease VII domain-containing protein n=1 Tax=Actinomadura sp. 6N118 TaxID=3375151 RepID=UPI00378E17A4
MTSKKCRDCGELKPVTEFWKRKASPDGLALYCKECFGLRNAGYYRGGQAKQGKKARPYRRHSAVPEGMKYCPQCQETKPLEDFGRNRSKKSGLTAYCRPCHTAVMSEIKQRTHGSERNYLLKLRYGITEQDVERMAAQQGGLCAICLSSAAKHVDHDHKTGKVRGLLCFSCNGALGQFGDDSRRMRAAAAYLERHPKGFQWEPVDEESYRTLQLWGFWVNRVSARAIARHRLSPRDVIRLGLQPGDECPICLSAPAIHVDHCHETGEVRGLLCPECNTGMGQLRDDPVTLRRAADYLERTGGRQVASDDGKRLSSTAPEVGRGQCQPVERRLLFRKNRLTGRRRPGRRAAAVSSGRGSGSETGLSGFEGSQS